jgi:hypothetical protein
MFLKMSGLNNCDLKPALVRVVFKMNESVLVSLYFTFFYDNILFKKKYAPL